MACVNDESKLSFSARSWGRYLVSSILLFFCGLDSIVDSGLFSIAFAWLIPHRTSSSVKLTQRRLSRFVSFAPDETAAEMFPNVAHWTVRYYTDSGIFPLQVVWLSSMHKGEMAQLHFTAMEEETQEEAVTSPPECSEEPDQNPDEQVDLFIWICFKITIKHLHALKNTHRSLMFNHNLKKNRVYALFHMHTAPLCIL